VSLAMVVTTVVAQVIAPFELVQNTTSPLLGAHRVERPHADYHSFDLNDPRGREPVAGDVGRPAPCWS